MEPKIDINEYNYLLPDPRIAKYPVENRDESKLLIYKNGEISGTIFKELDKMLPANSLVVFNNTRVVPARLLFRKRSGALIEIFCLEPHLPVEYYRSFSSESQCSWLATVGNAKRWKGEEIDFDTSYNIEALKVNLKASIINKTGDYYLIQFTWSAGYIFSQVMDICGRTPIPPYLKRDSQEIDIERYQTYYAKVKGSVAAPTAGLHFTGTVLDNLDKKGITRDEVCLHVGAGTFLPVKTDDVKEHRMHSEPFSVSRNLIELLLRFRKEQRDIILVGTTTARTVESLYFLGKQCIKNGFPGDVSQWEPYEDSNEVSVTDSLEALINWMDNNKIDNLERRTEVIIVPGYKFNLTDVLITNFHQPKSTLLLLISAFVGKEWRLIYDYALKNDFRFLSYGDSSLLFYTR